MKPKMGLSDQQREGVIQILNTLLSDEYLLYTRTLNFHWNVVGMHFHTLHTFFEKQYRALLEILDETAEWVRVLGGRANGTMAEFIKDSRLKEEPGDRPKDHAMIQALLNDHEHITRVLREDLVTAGEKYKDVGIEDFLTGLMEKHQQMAWMLRAHLDS
jgi:starvation-inducible DNA-binding protein